MISQTYVSQSLVNPADRSRVMDDILTASIARNTMLGITGLLIASPDHFAELLEGPVLGVAAVMASIMADPRHTACRLISQSRGKKASYLRWRMARFDCQNFGNVIIDPLLLAAHDGADPNAVRRLEHLIATVAMDPAGPPGCFDRR